MSDSKKPSGVWKPWPCMAATGPTPPPARWRCRSTRPWPTRSTTRSGADLFDLKVAGNIYTRIMNPTTDVLEQRSRRRHRRAGAGLGPGRRDLRDPDHRRGGRQHRLVQHAVWRHLQPVRPHAAAVRHHHALRRSTRYRLVREADQRAHKAIFAESVGNPLGNITDIAALAELAHRHGLPLIVDNTVPSPYLLRPIEHGADIVVQSLTKYLGGHGTSLGGTSTRKFPWAERLNEPDISYHGVVYTEAFGPAAYIGRARGAAAQHRRGDLAVQFLPDPAGHRDAGVAGGSHRRERGQGRRLPARASQGRMGQLRRPAGPPTTPWCRSTWAARRRACSPSA